MNETEMKELMTVPGFFGFLARETTLSPDEVQRIYMRGRPWGLWPPDLDLSHEAAEAGVDVVTYLAALQPLVRMDTEHKEAELTAYAGALARGDSPHVPSAMGGLVEKIAVLTAQEARIVCDILRALYRYRQRVGTLSVETMLRNKALAVAKLQKVMEVIAEQRSDGSDAAPPPH